MSFVLADKYRSGPHEGRPMYFHSWTGIGPSATPKLADAERFPSAQAAMQSPAFSHWASFYEPREIDEEEPEACFVCLIPFRTGDRVLNDASGGALHAACCGPERESYVRDVDTGEPLGPNDPIPTGYVWTP